MYNHPFRMQFICIFVSLFQVSAEIQDYLTNRITKGHVPSYQLYLHLSDLLKLAENIPTKYVCDIHLYICMYVHMYICMCIYVCIHYLCVCNTVPLTM